MLIESWLAACPYPRGVNWTSSLELGLRLVNWSFAWHLLGGESAVVFAGAAGQTLRLRWLASVRQHCHFIAGHLSRGSSANNHLLGELLMLKGDFRMTEIPYRGSAPAINDLLAGNIDLVPDYLLANKANIDAGKLKFLATGSRERPKDYPKVATIAETLPGVYADTWMGVAAPPGTPKEIAKKVSDAIGQGLRTPEMRARILALEAEPLGSTPDQMRDIIRQSLETWGPVVEAAKIVVE